ncbi:MAG TPA: Imm1 family immunity protein [Mycobacteriales bacterium]|nr:Imm1 family immunity protein [Mycobacteriales bacterium]
MTFVASWTGQAHPVPIRGAADLSGVLDAVYRLIGAGETGEILRLRRADGAVMEVWLDVPDCGGWAFSFTDPDGRAWLTGSGPLRDGEPALDFRYYDAWNQLPVSCFVPGPTGRSVLFEFAATGRLLDAVPWRAL